MFNINKSEQQRKMKYIRQITSKDNVKEEHNRIRCSELQTKLGQGSMRSKQAKMLEIVYQ